MFSFSLSPVPILNTMADDKGLGGAGQDRDERESLTDNKTAAPREFFLNTASVSAGYVEYFLNKDIYNSYPLSQRFKRQFNNFITCRKQGSFVDQLGNVGSPHCRRSVCEARCPWTCTSRRC